MKMQNIIMTIVAIFVLAGSASSMTKGDDNVIKESRQVGTFTAVSAGGAFNIMLKQTGSCSVEVEADAKIMEYITTKVEGNTLKIGMKKTPPKCWNDVNTLNVYITMDQLDELDLSGASEVKMTNMFKGKELDAEFSGASEIDLNLSYSDVKIEISGAAELDIEGTISNLDLEVSGASEIDAFDADVQNAKVFASGASDVKINASESISISASGACDVKYKGNAKLSKFHSSGASDIKKVD